MSSNLGR